MNQKLKYVGLLAILPLLTIPLTMNGVAADTAKAQGHPGGSVTAFGDKTKDMVCGDRLCSEIDDKQITTAKKEIKSEGPYAEQFGISSLGENMFKVTFTVYAGNEDLQDGVLHVSSDVAHKEAPITKVFANSYAYVPVLILADDPGTILTWID